MRLSNPKIAASLCDISPAALALLALCGFSSAADGESVCMSDAAAAEASLLASATALLQTWAELPAGALPAPPHPRPRPLALSPSRPLALAPAPTPTLTRRAARPATRSVGLLRHHRWWRGRCHLPRS